MTKSAKPMRRYAAKLLFQYQVATSRTSDKRRTCEERIVLLRANSAGAALALAKRRGKQGEYEYTNHDGDIVRFEFLGVMELLVLDPECDPDEVWYEIVERVCPEERLDRFVPPESQLSAIRHEPHQ